MAPAYSLAAAAPDDVTFLYELARVTMRDYVAEVWGEWDEEWQRHRFYANFHPDEWKIILVGAERAGGVATEHRPGALYVSRLYLLPEYQRRGIGSAIIRDLQTEAAERGVPVALDVLRSNLLARKLYERLGFRVTHESETRYDMTTDGSGGMTQAESMCLFRLSRVDARKDDV